MCLGGNGGGSNPAVSSYSNVGVTLPAAPGFAGV